MRNSYSIKLLVILIGLVTSLQIATYLAARTVIRDTVLKNAVRELTIGGDVFSQLMQTRAQQLTNSVTVLVSDFGFKQAIASGDAATLKSALQNHAARVGADYAMVFDNSGRLVIALSAATSSDTVITAALLDEADRHGATTAIVMLEGEPYQLVLATIRAPIRIGWAGMGFKIDRKLATDMKRLTHLEISFATRNARSPNYLVGTLPDADYPSLQAALQSGMAIGSAPRQLALDNKIMMTLATPLGENIIAVLQIPMERILAPFYRLSQQLGWIALLGLILAAALATLLARNLSSNVKRLAIASQQIAAGDYAVIEHQSNDELGDLATALNHMQSAIAERETRILFQSQHDQLTGLANRALAQHCLQQSIERAITNANHCSVLVLDLNQFKAINDSFGDDVGDQVLKTIAQRMQSIVKQCDTAVRLDGDEFMLILDGVNPEQAYKVARRVQHRIGDAIQLGDLNLLVEASFGIATCPMDGASVETLMRRATIAMRSAKQNNLHINAYQPGWDELHLRQLALVRDLAVALETDGLSVVYQPKLSLRDNFYLGAEALVRWRHPTLGALTPDEFIPLAESSGNITHLTRWVLMETIGQIAHWQRNGLDIVVSVNISAIDLLEQDMPAYINSLLKRHRVAAHKLCLELTESSIMRETQHSMAMLQQLKDMDIRLSIDDFGTGYSSLSQLKKLPVDELKIDKSFVLKLADNEDDTVIVRSTIELGHNMGLDVVAEGVENESSQQILAELGCDMVQGFFYSRPLPAQDFLLWVSATRKNFAQNIL